MSNDPIGAAEAQLAALLAERDECERLVREGVEQETVAVAEALAAGEQPYGKGAVNSDAMKIRRRRAEAQSRLGTEDEPGPLPLQIEATQRVLERLRTEAARERLAERFTEARRIDPREKAVWERLGSLFAEIVSTHAEFDAIMAERSGLDAMARAELAQFMDEDVRAEWAATIKPYVEPVPTDVVAAINLLVEAALDPRQVGYRNGTAPLDRYSRLVSIVPDCRDMHRALHFSLEGVSKQGSAEARGYLGMPGPGLGAGFGEGL
jgi:hypothetical protein